MTNQKISKILFYIFIFLLPWQTRFIFTSEKPEFLSFSIYLSEILLWFALAWWLTSVDLKKISSVPLLKKGGMGGILLFCFFAFLSIAWSSDRIAAFRLWLFIFDGIMVYLYLQNSTPPLKIRGGWPPARLEKNGLILSDGFINKNISSQSNRPGEGELCNNNQGLIYVFLFSLFIVSLFGIWQFFNLGSGAFKWLGLAERGAWNLGDIVIEAPLISSGLNSERWLRAYGPFPHPNIFGGYLAAGILLIFYLISRIQNVVQSHNILYKHFLYLLGGVIFFALFLTFSRSAWVASIAASAYIIFKIFKNNGLTESVAAATDSVKDGRREIIKFFVFLFSLAIIFSIIFWPLIKTRVTSTGRLEQKSNTERLGSLREGVAVWLKKPLLGVGPGNYLAAAKSQIPNPKSQINQKSKIQNLKFIQPPHNIFIMILAELGFVGFLIYLFVWKKFWSHPATRPLLILFFVIGMLDHYFWTLWTGQMLFWTSLAFFGNVNDEGGGQDGSAGS